MWEKIKEKTNFSFKAMLQLTSRVLYSTYVPITVAITPIQATSSNTEFLTIHSDYAPSFIPHSLEHTFANYLMV